MSENSLGVSENIDCQVLGEQRCCWKFSRRVDGELASAQRHLFYTFVLGGSQCQFKRNRKRYLHFQKAPAEAFVSLS